MFVRFEYHVSSWVGVSEIVKSSNLVVRSLLKIDVGCNVDRLKVCPELEVGDVLDLLPERLSVVLQGEGDLAE